MQVRIGCIIFEQTHLVGEYHQAYWCSTYNKPCKNLVGGKCDSFPCLSVERTQQYDYQI